MKYITGTAIVITLMAGCESQPIQTLDVRPPGDVVIELFKENGDRLCIKKTRTKEKNCSKHKDDISCDVPGDRILWVWKHPNVSAPFQIVGKTNNSSPFQSALQCTDASSAVTCVIDPGASEQIYEYKIVVNPGVADECTLDPRILIY